MKRSEYMSAPELLEFLKIGILAGEAAHMLETTKDKEWHKKLATIATYSQQITDERLQCLDPKQLLSVARRNKHSEILLSTKDELRIHPKQQLEEKITVNGDDLYDLVDLANRYCMQCPQGECVEKCFYRGMYHRLGMCAARDEVKKGECEFRANNDIIVQPPPVEQMKTWQKQWEEAGATTDGKG